MDFETDMKLYPCEHKDCICKQLALALYNERTADDKDREQITKQITELTNKFVLYKEEERTHSIKIIGGNHVEMD